LAYYQPKWLELYQMESWYTIDANDRLIAIDGPWDTFALENGGELAVTEKVIGHQVWHFIDGVATRSFLDGLFFFCRQNSKPFETTYRCDSLAEKRLFRMTIEPEDDGSLLIRHYLVSSVQAAYSPVGERIQHWIIEAQCSVCNRFRIGNVWVYPFSVAGGNCLTLGYTVCPDCMAAAQKQLETASVTLSPLWRDGMAFS
jgi:hypothetical protein